MCKESTSAVPKESSLLHLGLAKRGSEYGRTDSSVCRIQIEENGTDSQGSHADHAAPCPPRHSQKIPEDRS